MREVGLPGARPSRSWEAKGRRMFCLFQLEWEVIGRLYTTERRELSYVWKQECSTTRVLSSLASCRFVEKNSHFQIDIHVMVEAKLETVQGRSVVEDRVAPIPPT